MSSQTDEIYLADMLAYAREAYSRVVSITYEEYAHDKNLEYAIRYLLMVVGEAASKVSDSSRKRYPGIEWPRITGMRNQLVHGYTQISRDIVWDTAVDDLAPLIADLESPPAP
jgi:uncharacterized protein with HEPN domain